MKPRTGSKKTPKGKPARKKFTAPENTKTGASGAAVKSEAAKPSEVRKLTPASTLTDLLKTCRDLKQNMDTINGELREKIAYAKDKKGLHTGAFAQLRKLDKMEAEKAADYWDTLLAYMDSTGITEKIESVGRLPLDDEKPAPKARAERAAEEETETEPAPVKPAKAKPDADAAAAEANTALLRNGIKPAEVSKPHFGQPAAKAPGGDVVMLDDKRPAAAAKH